MTKEELLKIATESPETLADAALDAMASEDRNVRVFALRILAHEGGPKGAQAIVAGLNDPVRRVRRVAAGSAARYLSFPEVVSKLQAMAEDDDQKIRAQALHALTGSFPGQSVAVPAIASAALESLMKADKLRQRVFLRLVQMELTDEVDSILREFVKNGTREEAVMATRRLCGFRVWNIGSFPEEERKKITKTAELAFGRVFYWVKEPDPLSP